MITTRAKFTCISCTLIKISRQNKETNQWYDVVAKTWKLSAVSTGSDDNKNFFALTPSGTIELNIVNPEVEFELGAEYYIDFTKARCAGL